ncbi:MAG: DNA polymerase I [Bacteroidales bacterium]|nr:DNA polymerase I [Bacteroidales bacterium]
MNSNPKLFLLDAYALIFRAYYAFINRPMVNSKGINTSAIFGFTSALIEIIRKEKPDYIAVAFDPPAPTFRNSIYENYKANRLKTPEEIIKSEPYIKLILEALNVEAIQVDGYEADDVIGTLAKKAEEKGWLTYMVTPDKDFAQLVSDKTFMYKPSKGSNENEIIGIQQVKDIFKVDEPFQVIDILALWGDSTDNIPGVPGIGEKTSKELIAEYKTIDNLFANREKLKGRLKENIVKYREQIYLSRKLARIVTEVPLELEPEKLKLKTWNVEKVKEIFRDLEFRTLLSRTLETNTRIPQQGNLFYSEADSGAAKQEQLQNSVYNVPHQYHLVSNHSQLKNLVQSLLNLDAFCFDTETTGLNVREAEIIGLSVAFESRVAYYISLTDQNRKEFLELLRAALESLTIKKIGQNLKFDLQILKKYGIEVEGPMFDTMIAHYLIQPELRHNMDYLAEIYLNYKTIRIEELIGDKGKDQKNMQNVDIQEVKEYACEDADITWQLYGIFSQKINEMNLNRLSEKVEMPLIKVLADMENSGFTISTEGLYNYSEVLKKEIYKTEKEIYQLAGVEFNISSPRQLGEILFDRLKITENAKRTKTKQYSTSEDVLSKIEHKHPIVSKILEYRMLLKLLNTYVDALPALINPETNKIHTSFDQAWVATGRLSSKSPNLQNIPVRDERGREIRKAFIPSNGNVLLSADYSQIELRLMAHFSEDENMIEAFLNQEDIHTATAAKIFKVPFDEVTREMRSQAKTANFGIIYGISAFGLAQRLNISRKVASDLIADYFRTYYKVKEYMNKSIQFAKQKGYVETIMGRRRYLSDINSANAIVRGVAERNAINAPLQGSAADIIKLAMVNIHQIVKGNFKTRMILQVHDELIFDVFKPELEQIAGIVKHEMEHAVDLRVPLTVDIGTGNNWLEAH